MRDLFLAFCLHPIYAFVFMCWIYFTVDSVCTSVLNIFVVTSKRGVEKK